MTTEPIHSHYYRVIHEREEIGFMEQWGGHWSFVSDGGDSLDREMLLELAEIVAKFNKGELP